MYVTSTNDNGYCIFAFALSVFWEITHMLWPKYIKKKKRRTLQRTLSTTAVHFTLLMAFYNFCYEGETDALA